MCERAMTDPEPQLRAAAMISINEGGCGILSLLHVADNWKDFESKHLI